MVKTTSLQHSQISFGLPTSVSLYLSILCISYMEAEIRVLRARNILCHSYFLIIRVCLETSQLRFSREWWILCYLLSFYTIPFMLWTFCVCKSKSHTDPTFERWGIQFKIWGIFTFPSEFHRSSTTLFIGYVFVQIKISILCMYILRHFWTQTWIFLFLIVSSRTPGQRAWEAEAGAGESRGHQSPLRTSPAPQTSRFSFHCFVVNLFSFLAKLAIYNRRLLQVSHKGSTANFYDIFSGIKVF